MRKGGACGRRLAGTLFSGKLLFLSGPLAQPGRALASHARGHWFKSSTVHCLQSTGFGDLTLSASTSQGMGRFPR